MEFEILVLLGDSVRPDDAVYPRPEIPSQNDIVGTRIGTVSRKLHEIQIDFETTTTVYAGRYTVRLNRRRNVSGTTDQSSVPVKVLQKSFYTLSFSRVIHNEIVDSVTAIHSINYIVSQYSRKSLLEPLMTSEIRRFWRSYWTTFWQISIVFRKYNLIKYLQRNFTESKFEKNLCFLRLIEV